MRALTPNPAPVPFSFVQDQPLHEGPVPSAGDIGTGAPVSMSTTRRRVRARADVRRRVNANLERYRVLEARKAAAQAERVKRLTEGRTPHPSRPGSMHTCVAVWFAAAFPA